MLAVGYKTKALLALLYFTYRAIRWLLMGSIKLFVRIGRFVFKVNYKRPNGSERG